MRRPRRWVLASPALALGLVAATAACAAEPAPTVVNFFFPRHGSPLGAGDAALLEGELVFEDACLWVRSADGSRHLVLWSSDVTLASLDGRPAVVTGDGAVLARTGERLGFGGSATDRRTAARLVGPIPARCGNGGFWVLSVINGRP